MSGQTAESRDGTAHDGTDYTLYGEQVRGDVWEMYDTAIESEHPQVLGEVTMPLPPEHWDAAYSCFEVMGMALAVLAEMERVL